MTEELGEVEADWYGEGGVVAELETEVRDLLGKPAAVFMPSGTMAQQIALRVHADRTGRRVVLWHPTVATSRCTRTRRPSGCTACSRGRSAIAVRW